VFARAGAATPRAASLPLLRVASNAARTSVGGVANAAAAAHTTTRWISTSSSRNKGLSPDSEDPTPKQSPEVAETPKTAAPLEEAEFHELADEYLNAVLTKFEELQDQRPEVDVEFSV
jgi:frataxin